MTLDTKLNTICTYVRTLLNKSTNVHLDLCRAVPIICFFPGCHGMADDVVPEQATAALRMHIGESTLQLWLVTEATENMELTSTVEVNDHTYTEQTMKN